MWALAQAGLSALSPPTINDTDPASCDATALGLLEMREHAAELGGELTVVRRAGEGTTLTAWMPVAQG